ncbi:MAG: response regulator [Nitrospinae bacterium]|nr:response regulator [Nitrospinota bacterium]MCH7768158.1 response regulator [Nitrospinota bacterium]
MKRILVIDDEENIRLLYKEELADEGYEVSVAASAEEALVKIEAERPDLITLDIRMPGVDGIEFLRLLRERDRDLPVIIVTAYGEYKQDFSVWASDAYVVKSADLDELKAMVRKVLLPT